MMLRRGVLPGVLLGAVLLVPCPARAADEPARSELWVAHCAKCHGMDGKAQTEEGKKKGARDLSNGKWQRTISDERMIRSITRGRDMMPAWGKVLTPEQIKELVKEVRSLAVPPL
jgi:mono/diheme cytochrome c family protein